MKEKIHYDITCGCDNCKIARNKTPMTPEKEKCNCLEDNKLTQAFCKVHSQPPEMMDEFDKYFNETFIDVEMGELQAKYPLISIRIPSRNPKEALRKDLYNFISQNFVAKSEIKRVVESMKVKYQNENDYYVNGKEGGLINNTLNDFVNKLLKQ